MSGGADDPAASGPDALVSSLLRNERLAEVIAMGVPSFVRRSQKLDAALRRLHERIGEERCARLEVLLPDARRVEAWRREGARLPRWTREVLAVLSEHERFAARPLVPPRRGDVTLRRLADRVRRFNASWERWLNALPLEEVRSIQADYNRYYAIERQCALREVRQPPFEPVALIEHSKLLEAYPPLTSPDSPTTHDSNEPTDRG